MGRRAQSVVGPSAGLGPIEPCKLDSEVLRSCPLAAIEQGAGLFQSPRAHGQVCDREPDAVIIRCHAPGLFHRVPHPFDRKRNVVGFPEQAQGFRGIRLSLGLTAELLAVQVMPADHPVVPPKRPVSVVADLAASAAGALEARFGNRVVPALTGQPAARESRLSGFRGIVGNAAPRLECQLGMALRHFRSAEPVHDVTAPGPLRCEPSQPRFRRAGTMLAQITLGLAQLGPHVPFADRTHPEPAHNNQPDPQHYDERAKFHWLLSAHTP